MNKINLTSSKIAWLKSQTKENRNHLFRAYAELEKFASEKDKEMFYSTMGDEDNFTVDEWGSTQSSLLLIQSLIAYRNLLSNGLLDFKLNLRKI